jgi:uncharacterized membrane protein YqiK
MRLAQSEQWCAYFASQLYEQAKKTALAEAAQTLAELDATKEKAARREAVKRQLQAERRGEKASKNAEARRLTADAERQAAERQESQVLRFSMIQLRLWPRVWVKRLKNSA